MGLQLSLMAVVSAIITWVVQVENAGFLNVFFEKKASMISTTVDPEYALSSDPSKAALEFTLRSVLLKPLALPILQSLPESLGGGQAGVDNAHAHPNREGDMLWITVSLFLLILILVIALQVINCCACCGGRKDVCWFLTHINYSLFLRDFHYSHPQNNMTYIVAFLRKYKFFYIFYLPVSCKTGYPCFPNIMG